jgi:hypothetical protein
VCEDTWQVAGTGGRPRGHVRAFWGWGKRPILLPPPERPGGSIPGTIAVVAGREAARSSYYLHFSYKMFFTLVKVKLL